ncbi:hypothetical protein [Rathayibacter tanaceti]|uniref:Uncharacterized protein n=2 Tax=Rathayibacter tanaceti TaxID=1671680 RepID=A0A162GHS6_9MICO|nr:hypothetical protein [Rathayibacter tanaceti]KZX21379.1 hypothetical protein ACH61_01475 [Rathayibacter tanaceti]QHC54953.1 hypothetical protein GSU10_04365 [Rathayibacter tanaceti]TCO38495.1 hypothetical protein EV639_102138 [Rathayibacter tanaceti]
MPDAAISDAAQAAADRVVDLVVATREQLEGVPFSTPPEEVSSALGAASAFGFDVWAPFGVDPAEDARRVARYWESLGMSIRFSHAGPSPVVHGDGGPVRSAEFDTGVLQDLYGIVAVLPWQHDDEAWPASTDRLVGD